jgi:PAS domain S-box-containing protein
MDKLADHRQGPSPDEPADREALRSLNERLRQVIRKLEETNRAQQVLMEASRDMLMARDESEVVALAADAVRRLLPGRRFCIRVVDPKALVVTSMKWDGPKRPRDADILGFKRSAFVKMQLPETLMSSPAVRILDEYEPVFEGTKDGLAMPLVASGQLFGLINLEYPGDGLPARKEEDGLLLRPLANQVSLFLRNVKLLKETLFLKEYLEKLVEGANALIVVLDRNRQVLVFNQELEKLTGYGKEEVVGTSFLNLLPPEERTRFLRVLINSMRGEPTSNFETRLRGKDGSEIRVAINTAAILTPQGDVEGVIAIGQDLTKIKDLEQQVIHAEKLATVGQLAAGVVHELNNPLTSISVYAEYLSKKLLAESSDPGDLEKVRKILEGAERIRQFTRDLVSYARPSGSKPVLMQVNDVVRQSVSFCEHILAAAGARVDLALDAELPRVYGIPGQLQQVFTNLLTNACDAVAEAGGGCIEIGSGHADGQVRVVVRDDGAGVRPADRPRIFEPFFTTKAPGKGTGLGLSIVKEIVESHGGRVEHLSPPGRGAEFLVALPVARKGKA